MFLSVALCTYNGELFIEKQLDSIINQTLKVDEIIICDDGSIDSTPFILKRYQLKYSNLIKVYNNKYSLGTIKNFEKAISLTKGDLIFLSDQDDVWLPEKTKEMVSFFLANKNCKLLFSNGELIDDNDKSLNSTLWDKWHFNPELQNLWKNNDKAFKDLIINNNKITGATVCIDKSLINNCIPIKLPLGYWHDAYLGIHASGNNSLNFIEACLIKYRIHSKQQIGVNNNIDSSIEINSNPDYINKKLFFSSIKKMYPNKKHLFPQTKSRKLINKIIQIFK